MDLRRRPLDLRLADRRLDRANDALGDLVLEFKDVLDRPIEAIRPQMRARRRVDQLARDAQPASRLANAAFEHVTHAKLIGHLAHVNRPAFVGEARIPRDHDQLIEARQRGDDVVDHAVDEIFLLGITRHVGEREDGDRRLAGKRGPFRRLVRCTRLLWRLMRAANLQRIDPQRLRDILQCRLAKIDGCEIEAGAHLPIGILGQANGAGRRNTFKPRRDVHAVAHQIAVTLLHDVTQVDADAELDPAFRGQARVALDHRFLDLDGTAHRIHDAAKLDPAHHRRSASLLDHCAPRRSDR